MSTESPETSSPASTPSKRTTRNGVVNRTIGTLHPRSVPELARRNYRRELLASMYLPFLQAVVESTIIAVVAKNVFEDVVPAATLNIAVAILTASNAFASIVSVAWVKASHGVDKIRFINGLQLAMIALVSAIAFVPKSALGLWMLVFLMLAARFCWSGFLTLRSTVWRQNYTRDQRAKITGRLTTIQVLSVAVLGVGLGMAMDLDDRAFRVFFPVGAALALIGVYAWSGVRVRGHRHLLKEERESGARDGKPSISPAGIARLLAGDRRYASYMGCMFMLGLGNLMVAPVLVIALRDVFRLEYLGGIAIASSIPFVMMPLSIPFWAKLLDRVHVIEFRAIHAWFFVTASLIDFAAVLSRSHELLYFSSAIRGLAFGGGALAWTLGHLDFAPANRAGEYMGVHVTLTGVRGLIAPFLAVGLWKLLESLSPGSGGWTFFACAVLSAAGGLGFIRLRIRLRRELAADPEKRDEAKAEGPQPDAPR